MRRIRYRFSILNSYMFVVSGGAMSFTEKVDVLELLIAVLMDHERKLDELVSRLESVSKR